MVGRRSFPFGICLFSGAMLNFEGVCCFFFGRVMFEFRFKIPDTMTLIGFKKEIPHLKQLFHDSFFVQP